MNEFPPIEIPGEPDALAEVRLRAELKFLRTSAIKYEMTLLVRDMAMQRWPGVHEAMEIIKPPLYLKALELGPSLKKRLLQIESYFIEKGWHLPKWERPSWLLE